MTIGQSTFGAAGGSTLGAAGGRWGLAGGLSLFVVLTLAPACFAAAPTGKPAAKAVAKTLIESYSPPPLAELDKTADWFDQPVVDFSARLRDYLAKNPPPISTAAALKLKNDSPAANVKILGALGRLPASEKEADWNATMNRHVGGDAKSMNPLMQSSVTEFEINSLTGFGLFSFDWTLEHAASADAVKTWQTSKDRLMDKVVMRDDLTWSDGRPITAHDVQFSFETIMNPDVPVPAVRSQTEKLRWVEAYDGLTLVFFHKEALATNVENINFPVIPRHVFGDSVADDPTLANSEPHKQQELHPVVGGPYTVAARERGQHVVLERRESYYLHNGKQVREKPYFKTVRLNIIPDSNTALLKLRNGEIDEMILSPAQWTSSTTSDEFYSRNTKATGVEWVYFFFGWNLKRPFFSDLKVRQAMTYAFDHGKMLKTLCYGLYEPANGVYYKSAWMAPQPPLPTFRQDLDKAEELLDAAGWIDHDGDGVRDKKIGGAFKRFEFDMLCANIPERVEVCKLLKQNLDEIGVVCNVRPREFADFQQQTREKNFDAMYGGWGTGTDPDSGENLWKTGEQRNYVSYSNPKVDQLFIDGRHEFDRAKRAKIYAQIDRLIYAEQPYTFLYFRNSFYGFSKQVRGYKFSPRGPFSYSPGFSSVWKVIP